MPNWFGHPPLLNRQRACSMGPAAKHADRSARTRPTAARADAQTRDAGSISRGSCGPTTLQPVVRRYQRCPISKRSRRSAGAVFHAPQNPRRYSKFSDAADDVVDARIYEGIHFRSGDEDARSHAKHIANLAFNHSL
jgi:hypothetical protein